MEPKKIVLQIEYAVDQVCDRNQNIIENTCRRTVSTVLRSVPAEVRDITFAEEGLDKSTTRTAIAPTDGKGLPNGHKRDDGVKEKRGNLRFGMVIHNEKKNARKHTKNPRVNMSDNHMWRKENAVPRRCAE